MSIDTSKMPPEKVPGHGIIRIDRKNFTELFNDLDIKSTDLQGKLHDDGAMATIHSRLLLPESYKVLGIFIEYLRGGWALVVESHDLPIADISQELPEVTPRYYKHENGTVELTCIEIHQWDGGYWKTVHTDMVIRQNAETRVSEEKPHVKRD